MPNWCKEPTTNRLPPEIMVGERPPSEFCKSSIRFRLLEKVRNKQCSYYLWLQPDGGYHLVGWVIGSTGELDECVWPLSSTKSVARTTAIRDYQTAFYPMAMRTIYECDAPRDR